MTWTPRNLAPVTGTWHPVNIGGQNQGDGAFGNGVWGDGPWGGSMVWGDLTWQDHATPAVTIWAPHAPAEG